jgi:hypothetical protein
MQVVWTTGMAGPMMRWNWNRCDGCVEGSGMQVVWTTGMAGPMMRWNWNRWCVNVSEKLREVVVSAAGDRPP